MATVLVVDDSAVDRRFVGGLLDAERAAIRSSLPKTDRRPCRRCAQSPPDVIVTDLQMPNRNGLELVAAVRMHHPDVPIILMTGHGSEDLAVEALQRGAAGYVPKPQLGERLLEAVDEALSMSQADRTYDRLISCLKQVRVRRSSSTTTRRLIDPLVDLVQQMVAGMKLTDATGRFRVGAALKEALLNAIYRGNLEISFQEMQDTRVSLLEGKRRRPVAEAPQPDALLAIAKSSWTSRIEPNQARFVIRDEGPGFDPASLPAAGQPGSLDPETGRGLVLMRAFMDEVTFNDEGNEVTLAKRRES